MALIRDWISLGLITLMFVCIAVAMALCGGCEEPDRTQAALTFLQEAKAEGNLVLTSEPVVAAGMDNRFYFGGDKTTVAFDGSIDFADRVRHVSVLPPSTRAPPRDTGTSGMPDPFRGDVIPD